MKIVILGDGLLGSELVKQTNWDYISRKKDGIDIFDFNQWMFKLSEYGVIINCIANTDTYSNNKELHWKVNYEFVDTLVNFCNETGKKLAHISTDYIYVNSKTEASEEDVPVHLETWYGYTKLLGDAHIQLKCKNYLIIRTSHKPYPFPYKNAWDNQFTNGDYVNKISELIVNLIYKNCYGIYNVGTEIKTWHSLTKKEFDTKPINAPINVPNNITMNINKFKHETTTMNTEMNLTKLNITNLIIDLDLIINDVIKLFKTDNSNYSIINKENLVNAFKNVYLCNNEIPSLLVDSIINLTISDLIIGKMHYTKKENQSIIQFRDNEIELRIAAEQRAKYKNLIDSYLKTISGKVDTDIKTPRLTNLNCFSAYIDRLITERIKHYNFKLDDKYDESAHQELLCKYIHDDMIYILIDVKSNGYFYIGEKRTFDEPKLIEYLKSAK